ncbi:MAG: cytochrome c biogenesis protein CcsA [Bdellovibrionales bacterium]|nr:cytochrome c biogenesis protein CcsA [Bdellovibrionales bacterium]
MQIERYINTKYLTSSRLGTRVLPLAAASLVLIAMVIVFLIVPTEAVMGAVQRIFYFHVGSAMACYAMIALVLVGSSFFLASREAAWDAMAEAAAFVAFVFASIVLVTGSIWGHSAWNTWWRWEPRLVSFLILWLLLFSYVLLRQFSAGSERAEAFAAVLGILIALNVPVVIFSIKLLSHAEQLHPEVVAQRGLRDYRFIVGLVVSNIALIAAALWFWWLRLTGTVIERSIRLGALRAHSIERFN